VLPFLYTSPKTFWIFLLFNQIKYDHYSLLFDQIKYDHYFFLFDQIKYNHYSLLFDQIKYDHYFLLFDQIKYDHYFPPFDQIKHDHYSLLFYQIKYDHYFFHFFTHEPHKSFPLLNKGIQKWGHAKSSLPKDCLSLNNVHHTHRNNKLNPTKINDDP
jgi:hypothetical protein